MSDNITEIRKSVEKLNSIAQKLDLKPIVLQIKDRRTPDWKEELLQTYFQSYGRMPEEILVFIDGEVPRVGDHEFIASIEPKPDEDGKVINILRAAPGKTIPDKYKKDFQGHCDHCCTTRYRKQTYLLKDNRDGSYKVVGGNCLADFLRKDDLGSQIAWFKLLNDLENKEYDMVDMGSKRYESLPTREFIKASIASIRKFGFKKSTITDKEGTTFGNSESTKFCVLAYLNALHPMEARLLQQFVDGIKSEITNVTDEEVNKLIDWIKTEAKKEDASAYIHNLYALSIQPYITNREAGMLASLPQAYIRATTTIEKKEEEKYTIPDWKIGDTISFIGKVKSRGQYTGQYGLINILNIHTDEGYYIKWFSSNFDASKGEMIRVEKAKVKSIELDSYLQKITTTIKGTSGTIAQPYDATKHDEYEEEAKLKIELPKFLKKDKEFQDGKEIALIASLLTDKTFDDMYSKVQALEKESMENYNKEKESKHWFNYQKYGDLSVILSKSRYQMNKSTQAKFDQKKLDLPKGQFLGIDLVYN